MSKNTWQAWVHVKWKPGTPSTAWEGWKGNPKVRGAWSTLGEWDCLLWLNVGTPDELEEFVWKEIRRSEWVERTQTSWAKQWC